MGAGVALRSAPQLWQRSAPQLWRKPLERSLMPRASERTQFSKPCHVLCIHLVHGWAESHDICVAAAGQPVRGVRG